MVQTIFIGYAHYQNNSLKYFEEKHFYIITQPMVWIKCNLLKLRAIAMISCLSIYHVLLTIWMKIIRDITNSTDFCKVFIQYFDHNNLLRI
jgi:hypothetical protein